MNPLLSPLRKSTAVFCALLALTACAGILAACRSGSPEKPASAAESLPAVSEGKTGEEDSFSSRSAAQESVEADLETILSSPLSGSAPNDYISAHRQEYENILKQGDTALTYLLAEFKSGRSDGLRGEIMKAICVDLLGDRNNVPEGSFQTAQEWYEKLDPYEPASLPKKEYWETTNDRNLDFVYTAAMDRYASQKDDTVTIAAPVLYGSETQGTTVTVFATVLVKDFQVLGDTVTNTGGAVIPAAITGTVGSDGKISACTAYTQAKDGSYWAPSIREFCGTHHDVAEKMISRYSGEDYETLLKKNLQAYLKSIDISPKYYSDSVEKISFADYLSGD